MSGAHIGVYPGSFNPPTTAHLAIAEAARTHHRLDRVVLSVSRSALAKEDVPDSVMKAYGLERLHFGLQRLQIVVEHVPQRRSAGHALDLRRRLRRRRRSRRVRLRVPRPRRHRGGPDQGDPEDVDSVIL